MPEMENFPPPPKKNAELKEVGIVGATRKSDGNLDTSRAMTILEDPAVAAKRERERNVRTVRNLNTVFGEVQHLGPEQQYYKSMVNEQMPLMTRYLREDTKRDESDWSDNSMAPGVALLGAAVARTGFGWHERD